MGTWELRWGCDLSLVSTQVKLDFCRKRHIARSFIYPRNANIFIAQGNDEVREIGGCGFANILGVGWISDGAVNRSFNALQ
jgi:hypothetical protein